MVIIIIIMVIIIILILLLIMATGDDAESERADVFAVFNWFVSYRTDPELDQASGLSNKVYVHYAGPVNLKNK